MQRTMKRADTLRSDPSSSVERNDDETPLHIIPIELGRLRMGIR